MRTSLLFGLLLLVTPADDVVGRLHGEDLDQAEFAQWLVERQGYLHAFDYVREKMILDAAEEAGQLPTEAELDEAWRVELQSVIDNVHHGDRNEWLAALSDRDVDPVAYSRRQREALRAHTALIKMASERREFDEAALRKRYKTIYGELGERLTLKVLKYDMWANVDPDADRPDLAKLRAAAQERALAAEKAWRDGADFTELLAESDDPGSDFVNAGVVSPYRKLLLGKEVELAVSQFDEVGEISPATYVWDGFIVVKLIERSEATFEEARDEIEGLLRATPVGSSELLGLEEEIRAKANPEVLMR